MRKNILVVILLAFTLPVAAQKNRVKNLVLHDSVLQHFLAGNPRLRFIIFERYVYEDIKLFPDTSTTGKYKEPYENKYDMGFLGHQYLVEKRFGRFPYDALERLLDSLKGNQCNETSFKGTITAGSVRITVTRHCPSKNEDRVFFKVPQDVQYPGGEKAFTKHMQNWLDQTSGLVFPDKDSVLLLKMIVRKTGQIEGIQFSDSSSVEVNNAIRAALLNSAKWNPAMQGGQWVHSYAEVFIRIRKDGTIEADYY